MLVDQRKSCGIEPFRCGVSAALPAEHHPLPPRKSQVECRRSCPVLSETNPGEKQALGWRRGGVAAKTCAGEEQPV